MSGKPLADCVRCEAAKPDGTRCDYAWTVTVSNPGAYMPYRVCGTHERQGSKSVAATGAVPVVWTDNWKRWAAA